MSSRQRLAKVGGKRSDYGNVKKLDSNYKKPNYPGQGTAVLTKLSKLFEGRLWTVSSLPWDCLAAIMIQAQRS